MVKSGGSEATFCESTGTRWETDAHAQLVRLLLWLMTIHGRQFILSIYAALLLRRDDLVGLIYELGVAMSGASACTFDCDML